MGILGYVVLGTTLGALAALVRGDRDPITSAMTGAATAMIAGVLVATMRNAEVASFFSWRSWLVAGAAAIVALILRARVTT